MNKIILFVDDEQEILDALRRMLHPLSDRWDMVFESNGQHALDLMAENSFDVIVSDMQMPGMNGAKLLSKVREWYPQVIRIILTGRSDTALIPQVLTIVHQFLGKPVESKRLISTVTQVSTLKDLLKNDTLSEVILRMEALPSHPTLYAELRDELQTPKPSTDRVGDIISRDMGLTLRVLQLLNSGYVALDQSALEPRQAVNIIGINTIKDIADSAAVLPEDSRYLFAIPPLRDLWEHSLRSGQLAKEMVKTENLSQEVAAEVYLAAFLHDIGKIVLAVHFPEEYAIMLSLANEHIMTHISAERQLFGSTITSAGAFLLGLWGMPNSIVLPVARHHEPHRCQDRHLMVPTAIVHTANIFEHAAKTGDWGYVEDHLDMEFLDKLNLKECLPIWWEASKSFINSEVTDDVR
ncbi:HDOD domain-containing protein [Candidatus Neomarinimicrobiota bacterium]